MNINTIKKNSIVALAVVGGLAIIKTIASIVVKRRKAKSTTEEADQDAEKTVEKKVRPLFDSIQEHGRNMRCGEVNAYRGRKMRESEDLCEDCEDCGESC